MFRGLRHRRRFADFSFGYRRFTGSYVVVDNPDGTYTVTMDLLRQDDGSNTPLMITRTFRDNPGFTSVDGFGRSRGGSSLSFLTGAGREFLYEKQW